MPHFNKRLEEQQRALAYQLWKIAGKPEGRQEEFWHQAEAQLAQDERNVPNSGE